MRRFLRRSDAQPDSETQVDSKPRGFFGGGLAGGNARSGTQSAGVPSFSSTGNASGTATGSLLGDASSGTGITLQGIRWWGQRNPLLTIGIPIALLLMTIAVTLGVYQVTRRSSERIAGSNLASNLSANLASLDLWLDDQQNLAKRIVDQPSIQPMLVKLLDEPSSIDAEDQSSLQTTRDAVASHFYDSVTRLDNASSQDLVGWVLLDDQCQAVLQSRNLFFESSSDLCNAHDRAYESGTSVAPPVMVRTRQNDQRPAMAALASVRRGVRPVGTFALLINPNGRFTELLSIARTGESGETYAFNSAGQLISRSRFEDQLAEIGLIESMEGQFQPGASILTVRVCDPGTNLLSASESQQRDVADSIDDFALTRMVASAIDGNETVDAAGYRDYRGVRVIGAGRWLDRYGFGVTSEIDVEEAFQPLNLIRKVMLAMLGMLALAGTGLVGATYLVHRLVHRQSSIQGEIKRLGQYELFEVIGKGGMGTVYRGRHELLARDVAVKVLENNQEEVLMSTIGDDRARIRFEREVQLTSLLRHPNTINIYDYGCTADDVFFYVMEFIEGINLGRLIQVDGAQSPGRVIHLLTQVCGSLQEAHSRSLVHRDIKPGNIVLTNFSGSYDMVKVLDFGLVRSVSQSTIDDSQLRTVTPADAITGTPMYMAPEVIRDSSAADRRSDIYAIGAVGYQLLTGLSPYIGQSVAEICAKRLKQDPDRPSVRTGKTLPEDLQNVLMSCLRADPDERPQTADELAESLRQCRDAGTWRESDALSWWRTSDDELQPRKPITVDQFHGQETLATLDRAGFANKQLATTNPALTNPADGGSEFKTTSASSDPDATVSFRKSEFDPKTTESSARPEIGPTEEL